MIRSQAEILIIHGLQGYICQEKVWSWLKQCIQDIRYLFLAIGTDSVFCGFLFSYSFLIVFNMCMS